MFNQLERKHVFFCDFADLGHPVVPPKNLSRSSGSPRAGSGFDPTRVLVCNVVNLFSTRSKKKEAFLAIFTRHFKNKPFDP